MADFGDCKKRKIGQIKPWLFLTSKAISREILP
jgi:hypothetical protein